jgi:hypothetical protein
MSFQHVQQFRFGQRLDDHFIYTVSDECIDIDWHGIACDPWFAKSNVSLLLSKRKHTYIPTMIPW